MGVCSIVAICVQSKAATNQTDQKANGSASTDPTITCWANEPKQKNNTETVLMFIFEPQQSTSNTGLFLNGKYFILFLFMQHISCSIFFKMTFHKKKHSSGVKFPVRLQYSEYKCHEGINGCWTCSHWRREGAPEFLCRASSWRWVCQTAAAGWRRSLSHSRSAETQPHKHDTCSESRDGIEPATFSLWGDGAQRCHQGVHTAKLHHY